ncbi:MAG: hypothetical protein AAGC55_12455, partial [Myxococcota bacterium]
MDSIGIKTLLAVLAVLAAAAAASLAGVLDRGHLSDLHGTAFLVIGVFAALCTGVLSRLWRPRDHSRWYLAIRRGSARADRDETVVVSLAAICLVFGTEVERGSSDLPAWAQQLLFAATFVAIGLIAFDDYSTAHLTAIPDRVGDLSLTEYCPEPGSAAPAPEPEPPAQV